MNLDVFHIGKWWFPASLLSDWETNSSIFQMSPKRRKGTEHHLNLYIHYIHFRRFFAVNFQVHLSFGLAFQSVFFQERYTSCSYVPVTSSIWHPSQKSCIQYTDNSLPFQNTVMWKKSFACGGFCCQFPKIYHQSRDHTYIYIHTITHPQESQCRSEDAKGSKAFFNSHHDCSKLPRQKGHVVAASSHVLNCKEEMRRLADGHKIPYTTWSFVSNLIVKHNMSHQSNKYGDVKTWKQENTKTPKRCFRFLVFWFSCFLVLVAASFWPGRVFYVLSHIMNLGFYNSGGPSYSRMSCCVQAKLVKAVQIPTSPPTMLQDATGSPKMWGLFPQHFS